MKAFPRRQVHMQFLTLFPNRVVYLLNIKQSFRKNWKNRVKKNEEKENIMYRIVRYVFDVLFSPSLAGFGRVAEFQRVERSSTNNFHRWKFAALLRRFEIHFKTKSPSSMVYISHMSFILPSVITYEIGNKIPLISQKEVLATRYLLSFVF